MFGRSVDELINDGADRIGDEMRDVLANTFKLQGPEREALREELYNRVNRAILLFMYFDKQRDKQPTRRGARQEVQEIRSALTALSDALGESDSWVQSEIERQFQSIVLSGQERARHLRQHGLEDFIEVLDVALRRSEEFVAARPGPKDDKPGYALICEIAAIWKNFTGNSFSHSKNTIPGKVTVTPTEFACLFAAIPAIRLSESQIRTQVRAYLEAQKKAKKGRERPKL